MCFRKKNDMLCKNELFLLSCLLYCVIFFALLFYKSLNQPFALMHWNGHTIFFRHVHMILEKEEFFHQRLPKFYAGVFVSFFLGKKKLVSNGRSILNSSAQLGQIISTSVSTPNGGSLIVFLK